MKRIYYFFAAFALSLAVTSFNAPPAAEAAGSSVNVTMNQVILPPSCYDTINTAGPTHDYIAVFECNKQHD